MRAPGDGGATCSGRWGRGAYVNTRPANRDPSSPPSVRTPHRLQALLHIPYGAHGVSVSLNICGAPGAGRRLVAAAVDAHYYRLVILLQIVD